MKLIQISDLHFVPPGLRLLGLDPAARLAACIDDINRHHGDAACCLITGDLADRGAPEAYELLKAALRTLTPPYRLLIGNHDNRDTFRQAFPDSPVDDKGFVQSVVETPAGNLILLDTHVPGSHHGGYDAARCAWLSGQLAAAGRRPVFLFMHHPPFDIGIPSLDRIRLREEAELVEIIAKAKNIRHIFFGHVHRPVSGSWRDIAFSALPSTVHQVPLDFETVTSVPYDHEPPAYAVIEITERQTTVHLHNYLDDSRKPDDMPRYSEAAGQ